MSDLRLHVPDELLDEVARRAAAIVLAELEARHPADWMTAAELAEWLRVPRKRVYALAREGRIPSVRDTGRVIFNVAAVEAALTNGGDA